MHDARIGDGRRHGRSHGEIGRKGRTLTSRPKLLPIYRLPDSTVGRGRARRLTSSQWRAASPSRRCRSRAPACAQTLCWWRCDHGARRDEKGLTSLERHGRFPRLLEHERAFEQVTRFFTRVRVRADGCTWLKLCQGAHHFSTRRRQIASLDHGPRKARLLRIHSPDDDEHGDDDAESLHELLSGQKGWAKVQVRGLRRKCTDRFKIPAESARYAAGTAIAAGTRRTSLRQPKVCRNSG